MGAPSPRLELRQSQSLVMTQQLQQSIKLLQLTSLEIAEFIEQELEKNPLLAQEDSEQKEETAEPTESQDASGLEGEEGEGVSAQDPQEITGEEQTQREDWEPEAGEAGDGRDESSENTPNIEDTYRIRIHSQGEEGDEGQDRGLVREKTLREHLQEQLYVQMEDPARRMVGMRLIDLLDENGYVKEDLGTLADMLGCEEAFVRETLQQMQAFDPTGVFARDLAECLMLQLKERDRFDPAMATLVAHLDLLGKGDLTGLRKLCQVDAEDLADMIGEIKSLNPRPASGFSQDVTQVVEPDVVVKKKKGGAWHIELNSAALPRVLVNRRYYAQLVVKARDKHEKKYLSDQLSQASWIVRALDQRANTILQVATEIVQRQNSFLNYGIRFLKPMTLKDVALAIGLHESTVSRVTSGKYMMTSRGMYELKFFFNSMIENTTGGEDYSSRAVQHLIKELVDQETAESVLSDDIIADILKKRGVNVARRTVAKYREAMHIGSSVQRRREKAMQKEIPKTQ